MMRVAGVLACLLAAAVAHEADQGRQKRLWPTRCYPGSHCFPDQEDIALFKDVLDGSVVVPSDPTYPTVVSATNLRWTRSPGLVVRAASQSDVQRAVAFARHFYLNLVWSSTGNDYQGNGYYDGSLRLDLSALKSVTTSNLLQAQVAGTVTAEAGATWGEIYNAIEQTGFPRVLGGGTQSLDTVASFTMWGGLGFLSRSLGLASDQLLSATVVLANGNLAVASATQTTVTDTDGQVKNYDNGELFKTIQGAGLGFAVPVSFTFQLTLANNNFASLSASYKIVDDGNVIGRNAFSTIATNVAELPAQWGGYVSIDGSPDTNPLNANDRGQIKYHLFSYGFYEFNPPVNQLQNRNVNVEALRNLFDRNNNAPTTSTLTSVAAYRNQVPEAEQHFAQKENAYVMSALMNKDVVTNADKLANLTSLMMDVVNAPTVDSNWRCVMRPAGGRIANPTRESFVNAKLREATFSVACALMWSDGPTREDYYIEQALLFQNRLRALSNGGVDGYYASEDMEDWRAALYGANYYKLLDVKKAVDVDNYLWAHNAVASDFELNCNGVRCPHNH